MTDLQAFVAELATTIAAGFLQRETSYRDRRDFDRPSPHYVAEYSVRIAEEIVGLCRLGPGDLEALRKRQEARELRFSPTRPMK